MILALPGAPTPLAAPQPETKTFAYTLVNTELCEGPLCLFGAASSPGNLNPLANNSGGAFLGLFGPGGLLIGDGLDGKDAFVDPVTGELVDATAGGRGGFLWGAGGDGGDGLNAGFYPVPDPANPGATI